MSQDVPVVLRPYQNSDSAPASRASIAPINTPDIQMYPAAILAFYMQNLEASAKYVEALPQRKKWLDEHYFRPAANVCIDERVQDFPHAVGVPTGLLEIYRAGGSKSDLRSPFYAKRRMEANRKLRSVHLDHGVKRMAEMAFFTAHYSHSQPTKASCAAWDHKTDAALQHMVEQAEELNYSFEGSIVALPMLIDTDLDALTVVGPNQKRLAVRDLLTDPAVHNGSAKEVLSERLREVFPETWEPLATLDPEYRSAFYPELAERLVCNLAFVRNVQDTKRPIELLDHNGRIVFVGRHADWIEDHNTIFLIDDTEERSDVKSYFKLAMKYVTLNVLRDAIRDDNRDWRVPVIVNIPHDEEDDHKVTVVYTRKLIEDLSACLQQASKALVEEIFGPHGLDDLQVPDWLYRQAHKDFCSRVVFAGSVSYRKDRLFRPI